MKTDLLDLSSAKLNASWNNLNGYLQGLAEPRKAAQLRTAIAVAALIWIAIIGAQLVWQLLPQAEAVAQPTNIANPFNAAGTGQSPSDVDIDAMVSWNLFGDPAQAVATAEAEEKWALAGPGMRVDNIEKDARETRLALNLRGVVASNNQAKAVAIIEHKNVQKQYGVDDKLPVSGRVTVAMILPDRVVLDNSGKYELLKLFDKNTVSTRAMTASSAARAVNKRTDKNVSQMADSYRDRLYRDPQSLANVVKISAVRIGGQLQGYRVGPGADKVQFEQLGFRAGDVVTAVNGIQLTDAGKAVKLYQVMREATEASFDVLRGDETINIGVSFDPTAAQ